VVGGFFFYFLASLLFFRNLYLVMLGLSFVFDLVFDFALLNNSNHKDLLLEKPHAKFRANADDQAQKQFCT